MPPVWSDFVARHLARLRRNSIISGNRQGEKYMAGFPAKRVPTKHVGAGALTRPQHAAPNMIYHPTFCPLFCSSSHLFSEAKYSSSAPPSIFRSPVITSNASGHGLLWPISNILLNFAPASLEPKKVQRCSGPVYPEAWQSAR